MLTNVIYYLLCSDFEIILPEGILGKYAEAEGREVGMCVRHRKKKKKKRNRKPTEGQTDRQGLRRG